MTDAEIIKALEDNEIKEALKCCRDEDCSGCHYFLKDDCSNWLAGEALDLINRQKAKIEKCVDTLCKKEDMMQLIAKERQLYYNEWQMAKAEIERLNECVVSEDRCREIAQEMIPQFVKQARAEAIKEFAEKLKNKLQHRALFSVIDTINEVLREMVGNK